MTDRREKTFPAAVGPRVSRPGSGIIGRMGHARMGSHSRSRARGSGLGCNNTKPCSRVAPSTPRINTAISRYVYSRTSNWSEIRTATAARLHGNMYTYIRPYLYVYVFVRIAVCSRNVRTGAGQRQPVRARTRTLCRWGGRGENRELRLRARRGWPSEPGWARVGVRAGERRASGRRWAARVHRRAPRVCRNATLRYAWPRGEVASRSTDDPRPYPVVADDVRGVYTVVVACRCGDGVGIRVFISHCRVNVVRAPMKLVP